MMDENEQLAMLAYLQRKYPQRFASPRACVQPHDAAVVIVSGGFAALLVIALIHWESWGNVFVGGVLLGMAIVVGAVALWWAVSRRQVDQWWDQ